MKTKNIFRGSGITSKEKAIRHGGNRAAQYRAKKVFHKKTLRRVQQFPVAFLVTIGERRPLGS